MRAEVKALLSTLTLPLKSIPDNADSPHMDAEFLPNLLSGALNVAALCLFVAGVMKVFQIANTLSEIRDAVKDIQRNQDVVLPLGGSVPIVATTQSGDDMLRALDAQLNLHPTIDLEPVKPEIVDPR